MRRRDFIVALGAAAAVPVAGHAQQPTIPVVGYLASSKLVSPFVTAFRHGLSEFGYVDGTNMTIEYRSADGQFDRLPTLASDLVRRQVAVIAAPDGGPAALAAKAATATIPIVFIIGGDPVASGLVRSLARPGGNVTGLSVLATGLTAKRLELLHRLVPAATSIAMFSNPINSMSGAVGQMAEGQMAARALGVNLLIFNARSKDEIEAAFVSLAGQHIGALLVGADPLFRTQNDQIVELAAHYAIAASYESTISTTAGGLMSYGPDLADVSRQLGAYAGRILKGERPADLPVLQPTKFEFVINLGAAKALGLGIPADLLALADKVIE
jgi:putative tryptophan/tyrosine transport system substrate-binding protein